MESNWRTQQKQQQQQQKINVHDHLWSVTRKQRSVPDAGNGPAASSLHGSYSPAPCLLIHQPLCPLGWRRSAVGFCTVTAAPRSAYVLHVHPPSVATAARQPGCRRVETDRVCVCVCVCVCDTSSIAFWHLPPNSARFSYATEGELFISAQLSSDAVSALRKVPVLIHVEAT